MGFCGRVGSRGGVGEALSGSGRLSISINSVFLANAHATNHFFVLVMLERVGDLLFIEDSVLWLQ